MGLLNTLDRIIPQRPALGTDQTQVSQMKKTDRADLKFLHLCVKKTITIYANFLFFPMRNMW